MYEKIRDSLYEIKTERPSCTSYLILDEQKNILIDPGLYQKFDMLKENIRLSLCVNRIKKLIQKKYHYTLTPDEQTYLCIHIKKNCHI